VSNDGEDAASIAQHHLFIASECEKLRPNWEAVKSSMERTVSAHSAVMESSTTAEIVSHYSWITIPKLVIAVKSCSAKIQLSVILINAQITVDSVSANSANGYVTLFGNLNIYN